MSERNGDRAKFQRERQRKLLRRTKVREMKAARERLRAGRDG